MDEHTATRIADGIKPRFPDAQAVFTGGGFVNVFWTDSNGAERRSYVLGDEGESWGFDEYASDYIHDEDAEFLASHELNATTPEEAVEELLGAGA